VLPAIHTLLGGDVKVAGVVGVVPAWLCTRYAAPLMPVVVVLSVTGALPAASSPITNAVPRFEVLGVPALPPPPVTGPAPPRPPAPVTGPAPPPEPPTPAPLVPAPPMGRGVPSSLEQANRVPAAAITKPKERVVFM
jgi:hypothetical protein